MKYIIVTLLLFSGSHASAGDIISCDPKTLYYGEKLVIKLVVPHGKDFIINAPDNKSFEICFWHPQNSNNRPRPMFKHSECQWIDKVEIIAGVTATGGVNHDDRNFGPINDTIFNATGTYEVVVSPNLETDDPVISSCQVRYLGMMKKGPQQ